MKNISRFFNKYYWLRKFFLSKISNLFFSKEYHRKSIFRYIYNSNHWRDYKKPSDNESASGWGSDLDSTKQISKNLLFFLKEKKIKKILDIGCGDFLWMQKVLKNITDLEIYLGLDIVPELILKNNEKFSNEKIQFKNFDIVTDKIPAGFDIILVRDVFIHLENSSVKNSLLKLRSCDAKFLGITNSSNLKTNRDLKKDGRYRDINIEIEPFKLNNPIERLLDDEQNNTNPKDYLNIYKN